MPVPPIFSVLAERGPVAEDECYRAFNMGVGMVVITGREDGDEALSLLENAGGRPIGEVVPGDRQVDLV